MPSRSARMARPWPPPERMVSSSSGTSPRAASSGRSRPVPGWDQRAIALSPDGQLACLEGDELSIRSGTSPPASWSRAPGPCPGHQPVRLLARQPPARLRRRAIARSGSGTRSSATSCWSSADTPAPSGTWRSPPTARALPPPATTRPSNSGRPVPALVYPGIADVVPARRPKSPAQRDGRREPMLLSECGVPEWRVQIWLTQ